MLAWKRAAHFAVESAEGLADTNGWFKQAVSSLTQRGAVRRVQLTHPPAAAQAEAAAAAEAEAKAKAEAVKKGAAVAAAALGGGESTAAGKTTAGKATAAGKLTAVDAAAADDASEAAAAVRVDGVGYFLPCCPEAVRVMMPPPASEAEAGVRAAAAEVRANGTSANCPVYGNITLAAVAARAADNDTTPVFILVEAPTSPRLKTACSYAGHAAAAAAAGAAGVLFYPSVAVGGGCTS
jgi:hypothetical protein